MTIIEAWLSDLRQRLGAWPNTPCRRFRCGGPPGTMYRPPFTLI